MVGFRLKRHWFPFYQDSRPENLNNQEMIEDMRFIFYQNLNVQSDNISRTQNKNSDYVAKIGKQDFWEKEHIQILKFQQNLLSSHWV